MFEMCAQEGIATYTMRNTEVTDSRFWVQYGECLLLFAALIGIAVHINDQWLQFDDEERNLGKSSNWVIYVVRSLCMLGFAAVFIIIAIKWVRHWDEYNTGFKNDNSENSVRLTDYDALDHDFSAKSFMYGINIVTAFVTVSVTVLLLSPHPLPSLSIPPCPPSPTPPHRGLSLHIPPLRAFYAF